MKSRPEKNKNYSNFSLDNRKKAVTTFLIKLGYQSTVIRLTLEHIKENLVHQGKERLSPSQISAGENFILTIAANNLLTMSGEEQKKIDELSKDMQRKAGSHSCESTLKLLVYATQKKNLINLMLAKRALNKKLYSDIKDKQSLDKIFGYILSLNLNTCSYLGLCFQKKNSDSDKINHLKEKMERYYKSYKKFMEIDTNSKSDPDISIKRRQILIETGLLQGSLQRDPEEANVYDQQMLSARTDKQKLLSDVTENKAVRVIDIGPAGGTTFRDVVALGGKLTEYFGVEFDKNELKKLTELLSVYQHNTQTAKIRLYTAQFVEGNALDLAKVIQQLKDDFPLVTHEKLSIVLSSVIHEIYSYCPYQEFGQSIVTNRMTNPSEKLTYNVKTVEKVYREALIALQAERVLQCNFWVNNWEDKLSAQSLSLL